MKKPTIAILEDAHPALHRLFVDTGIKLVDIGGRGGAFRELVPLAPFADYYACEPDAAEADRLRAELPLDSPWQSVTVMSEAIASSPGEARLHLTYRPGMSSLLEPDPVVAGRFYLAQKFAVESVATVPTRPLDDAAAAYGFEDAAFLKLDTQGTELDILRSGEGVVNEALAVHTESLFQPFYVGQSLFADVDAHLRARGFSLFTLSRTQLRRAGFRNDSYSRRVIAWAHCLYLREPATLEATAAVSLERRLARLLALALAFQQHDLAAEVVTCGTERGVWSGDVSARLTADVRTIGDEATRQTRRLAGDAIDEALAPSHRDRNRRLE